MSEWQGPMYRDCGSCNFVKRTYGRLLCSWCAQEVLRGVSTLALNLSIAGGLCAAYSIGFSEGFYSSGEGFNGEYTSPTFKGERARRFFEYGGDGWRPGCGQAAP